MKIIETYRSVQGEGIYTGKTCVFVRMAGCQVRCKLCDTKYSWKENQGIEYTPEDLVKRIDREGVKRVIYTGGEPAETPSDWYKQFIDVLYANDYKVTVETSAPKNADIDVIKHGAGKVFWSLSPKLKGMDSEIEYGTDVIQAAVDTDFYQIKMVMALEEDWQLAKELVEKVDFKGKKPKVVFQPNGICNTLDEYQSNYRWLIEMGQQRWDFWSRYDPSYLLQNHKVAWGSARKV